MVVEAQFLLFTLNEHLARTALLVQPLCLTPAAAAAAGAGGSRSQQLSDAPPIVTIDVPLPLTLLPRESPAGGTVAAAGDNGIGGSGSGGSWNPFDGGPGPTAAASSSSSSQTGRAVGYLPSGDAEEVSLPPGLPAALQRMGLGGSLGFLRLLQEPAAEAAGPDDAPEAADPVAAADGNQQAAAAAQQQQRWLPLALWLGMPMQPSQLCRAVCAAAQAAGFLDAPARSAQRAGQTTLGATLSALAARHGACSTAFAGGGKDDDLGCFVDRPTHNLAFQGGRLGPAELGAAVAGVPLLQA